MLAYIHLIPIVTSFIGTIIFIYFTYSFSISIGLVDKPDWRKNHTGNIPVIGGLAIVFGFLLGCLLSPRSMSDWRPFFFCIIPLLMVGIMDDHGDISIRKRIIAQVITCLIMVYHGNIYLTNLGDILGLGYPIKLTGLEVLITAFCVVGVINSLNLIDGIDGLCGALSLVTCISIIIIVKLNESGASLSLVIYFSSALIAFLLVNLNFLRRISEKVFLGDTGTTIIGFFLSWHLIRFSSQENSSFRHIFAIWILAVPIMDTLSVMIRRYLSKKSPFKPARDHIHHILIDLGFSHNSALAIILLISSVLAGVGIILEYNEIPESYMFYSIVFIFVIYQVTLQKMTGRKMN